MGRVFGFISILVVAAIGLWLYSTQLKSVSNAPMEAGGPKQTIDITAVRMDLQQFARAEQQHLATDGHYVSLDDMRANDTGIPGTSRGPYDYDLEVSGNSFSATATYRGTPPQGVPRILRIGPEGTISNE